MKSSLFKLITYRNAISAVYIFIFTPVYYFLCRKFYQAFLGLFLQGTERVIYLSLLLAVFIGVYIFLCFRLSGFLLAVKKLAEPVLVRKQRKSFSSIRRNNSFLRDEIDILVESMEAMLANLNKQNKELVERRAQMQELAQTTLRSQETEKRILAHALHDESGYILTSPRVKISTLLSEFEQGSAFRADPTLYLDAMHDSVKDILNEIDMVYIRLRSLSHNLRPALLDVGDINLAMQEYCGDFQDKHHIIISYISSDLPNLTEEATTIFFRFLQEALANVIKHANATEVAVVFEVEKGMIKMSVQDNGEGGGEAVSINSGIGLLSMQERFNLLHGSVDSNLSDKGFTVTAFLPISGLIIKNI